jgi:hypothetical protein
MAGTALADRWRQPGAAALEGRGIAPASDVASLAVLGVLLTSVGDVAGRMRTRLAQRRSTLVFAGLSLIAADTIRGE